MKAACDLRQMLRSTKPPVVSHVEQDDQESGRYNFRKHLRKTDFAATATIRRRKLEEQASNLATPDGLDFEDEIL